MRGGTHDPRLTYTMTALPAEGLQGISLSLDGQVLKGSGKGGEKQDFTWPGTAVHGERLVRQYGRRRTGFITYEGLWAAFRFFGDADRFQASGAGYTLEWVPAPGSLWPTHSSR